MKGKLVLTIGFVGALALSIGCVNDFQNTKVFAQTEQSKVKDEQITAKNGDQYKVVSVEEQNRREGNVVEGKNVSTTISVEEQNMVENSLSQQGFVQQESGTGFFFTKVK